MHPFDEHIGPELPHRPQNFPAAYAVHRRAPGGSHHQKPPQFPFRPPQQKGEGRCSHPQGEQHIQNRGDAAKADAEGAQKIIAHRAGGPQQDGLKKQPPLGHISQKGG